jgi:hypothetical protein
VPYLAIKEALFVCFVLFCFVCHVEISQTVHGVPCHALSTLGIPLMGSGAPGCVDMVQELLNIE